MSERLRGLEPARILHYFEEISAIPRAPGGEGPCAGYLERFAEAHGLWHRQDALHNVVIKLPASPGCEAAPTVMLQAHLDIIQEKRPDIDFDFAHEGIRLVVEGEYIHADGTTLGADDGYGVALMLAFLESPTARHPAVECVFTTFEETTMQGALALDKSDLAADYLINLDSSRFDALCIGCAGSFIGHYEQPLHWERDAHFTHGCTIRLGGLTGGHSGGDAHRGRSNAILLLGRLLCHLEHRCDLRVADIDGGEKPNAIPRDAWVTLAVPDEQRAALEREVDAFLGAIAQEIAVREPNFRYTIQPAGPIERHTSKEDTHRMVQVLMLAPSGLRSMHPHFTDTPESSANLGSLKRQGDTLCYATKVRCNRESLLEEMADRVHLFAETMGLGYWEDGNSPVWSYDPEDPFIRTVCDTYTRLFGRKMILEISHGCCECGIFTHGVPGGLSAVSVGVDLWDLHAPTERMRYPSLADADRLIRAVIEQLAGETADR